MKLSTRLALIVGAAVLGMFVLGAYALTSLRSTMLEERKAGVEQLVRLAGKQVTYYQSLEKAGKLSREEAQARAKEAIRSLHDGDDYVFVRGGNGYLTSLVHPDPRKENKESDGGKQPDGRTIVQTYVDGLNQTQGNLAFVQIATKRPNGDVEVPKINAVLRIPDWDWLVGSGEFIDDIDAAFRRYVGWFVAIAGLLLVAVATLAVSLARGIYRGIGGEPTYAAEVARTIASGDLTQTLARPANRESLLAAVVDMQDSLKAMIGQIKQGADTLGAASDALTGQMSQINASAQRSADAISATAAAIEQMAVSVSQIADSAVESERNSQRASELAGTGGRLVDEAADGLNAVANRVQDASKLIAGLVERSQEIGSFASVIREIADQTNLLALNAAIEAARAGEQGRGFAVVADEVRKLAERSGTTTDQIAGVIQAIQGDTSAVVASMDAVKPQVAHGVDVAASAGKALLEINEGAGRTLANIKDVAHSVSEQRVASDSVAVNVEQISQMVEEMALSVGAANESVQSLKSLSAQLRDSVVRFRV